jgi:hypothetical protein
MLTSFYWCHHPSYESVIAPANPDTRNWRIELSHPRLKIKTRYYSGTRQLSRDKGRPMAFQYRNWGDISQFNRVRSQILLF